jgi:hypothetical protein
MMKKQPMAGDFKSLKISGSFFARGKQKNTLPNYREIEYDSKLF